VTALSFGKKAPGTFSPCYSSQHLSLLVGGCSLRATEQIRQARALARLAGFGLVERCVDGQPRQHAACRPHLLGVGSHPVPEASCALEADLHRTIANGSLGAALQPTYHRCARVLYGLIWCPVVEQVSR
jgi:hypothetical protein